VLARYARLALWVFLVVITTGTVSGLLLVPLTDLFGTGYGRVLVVKLTLVAVATGLALTARLTLRRPRGDARIRTVTRVEGGVLIAVLAVSAVLVSTPPAAKGQPAPPPPRGQVLPLGALAGQIGVSVAASDDQLVVRLSTPSRGNEYDPQPAQDYTLSGQLADAAGGGGPVDFQGCGEGCFVAKTPWADGDNVLTLQAQAPGWRPGTVSMLVPWPAQPGDDDLTRAVAALRAAGRVTVYETVTSDTSTTAGGEPTRLDLDAEFFLGQEPYATGVAPIATRISRPGQPVRLALGYPAASINVLLTLDQDGRIGEETLTDDTHLIHRRFVYPDHE
jgi:copper transport protein